MSEQVKGIPERAPEPPYMDFPEAWAFVRTTKLEDHHMRCSWRSGVLCDCNVLWAEYYKRKAARSKQALAALEARNKKAEALLLRWNKAAGWYCAGSEFVDDPERVFESIKSRMEMREKLGQRKAETAARAALKGAS